MRNYLLLSLVAIFFFSCDSETTYDLVTSDNGAFSVNVPSHLTKATDLNEDATIQYQNIFREYYFIVIEETKEEFADALSFLYEDDEIDAEPEDFEYSLEEYADLVTEFFGEGLEVINETDLVDVEINGLKAKQKEMDANFEDLEVYYHLTVIEGDKGFYQVLQWTLGDKKAEAKPVMAAAAGSFKEN